MILLASGARLGGRAGAGVQPRVIPPTVALQIFCLGDSMTRDMDGNNWSQQLQRLIVADEGVFPRIVQRGINGISYQYAWPGDPYSHTMLEDVTTYAVPRIMPGIPNWACVLAGSNGIAIAGHSGAQEYADFLEYRAALEAAGFAPGCIIVATMPPRGPDYEATRVSFNAHLTEGAATYGYQLYRLDQDPDIGAENANLHTDWYLDGIHGTAAWHTRVALGFKANIIS